MLIKLIPKQIPFFWDTIKYGCKNADTLTQENYQPYFNELLHALLSDKAQCFIRLSKERKIVGVLVTRFIGNKVTGEKHFHLQCAYSFQAEPRQTWIEDHQYLLELAKKTNCTKITFETSNPKLRRLAEGLGFKEISRSYAYDIRG